MRTITLEEHITTESFIQVTAAAHAGRGGAMAAYLEKMNAALLDVEEGRIAAMDAAGIDVQVLSLAGGGTNELAPSLATELCTDANQKMANAIAAHPTRFAAFAALPVQDPLKAAQMLETWVGKGFKGALISGTVGGKFLDRDEFLPIFEAAQSLDVPIYLHPAPPPAPVRDAYFADLQPPLNFLMATAGWGWHVETGLHALRLMASGLFDRLPTLKIIIGHMGEDLPYSIARANGVLSRAVTGKLQRSITDYFLQQFWVTTSGYFTLPPAMCALSVLKPDRLMLSVDYPFSDMQQGTDFLSELQKQLPQEQVEKIASGNAAALLHLSTPTVHLAVRHPRPDDR